MNLFLIASAAATAVVAPTTPAAPMKHPMKAETRAEAQAHAQRLFARLDTNKDGFVTQAEADAIRTQRMAKKQERMQHRDPAKMFDRLDTNKDGQVTRAEADAAHAARAAKRSAAGKPVADRTALIFERADSNRDGKLTRAELAALPKGSHGGLPHPADRHPPAAKMLSMGDANKDGRLSLAEAQQLSLQRFDRVDVNHDGTVTPEERKQRRAKQQ